MVTGAEMSNLCEALHSGQLPPDLRSKINRLRADDLRECYLKQQSLLLASFLMSPGAIEFCRLRPQDCQRLLRMLAYVRKDEDAIPDTWPDGMLDDYELMRMICTEMREILDAYKQWHLSRRVPLLWNAGPSRSAGTMQFWH